MKTLRIIAILAPWRKSDFLWETHAFYGKKVKICRISWKFIKLWKFHKFSKKWIFMQLKQGPTFHGKWWNSSISLKLGETHQISPNSMDFGEFHGISPFLVNYRTFGAPPQNALKTNGKSMVFGAISREITKYWWFHQILVIMGDFRPFHVFWWKKHFFALFVNSRAFRERMPCPR